MLFVEAVIQIYIHPGLLSMLTREIKTCTVILQPPPPLFLYLLKKQTNQNRLFIMKLCLIKRPFLLPPPSPLSPSLSLSISFSFSCSISLSPLLAGNVLRIDN